MEEMQRRPVFRPSFRKYERPIGEVERRQILPSAKRGALASPMQAPRDHQMQHQPIIVLQSDGDSLADAAQFPHYTPLRLLNRRLGRPQ